MLVKTPDYRATLDRLAQLSRIHLVFFRLEVGRLLLEDFFGGDPAAYQSHNPTKPNRFREFLALHGPEVSELGLGERVLRQCIVAQIAVSTLPQSTLDKLLFSHVVELCRVRDMATRHRLALATTENQWSSRQLRDAVEAVAAGQWIDGQPDQPGLQPAAPEEERKSLPVGRVVTRFEKAAEDLDDLGAQFSGRKVSRPQRERVRGALERLKAKIAELEAALAADSEG